MKAAPAMESKAENTPPLRARGHPRISLKKHTPDDGGGVLGRGPDSPGPRGSAAVLISGMKNPGLSEIPMMYTKGCIAFRRFRFHWVKLSRQGNALSSISTLKFRACKNCELGFDNHKNFEEEEWHRTLAILGRAEALGCYLFSRKVFPSRCLYGLFIASQAKSRKPAEKRSRPRAGFPPGDASDWGTEPDVSLPRRPCSLPSKTRISRFPRTCNRC